MRKAMMIGLACSLLAGPASAQNRYEREGFWIGFGLGGGVNLSQGLDGDQLPGGGAFFRVGGTPNSNVLLGFEVIGWGRERNTVTLGRGNATFVILLYPTTESGVFVKAGVGGASLTTTQNLGPTTISTSTNGFGATLGAGFDVPLGRVNLTPGVDWLFQAFDPNDFPFRSPAPSNNSILLFTIGLIWH